MLGAYVTVTAMERGWPFFAARCAFLASAIIGVALERAVPPAVSASDLSGALLTLGVVFVSVAAAWSTARCSSRCVCRRSAVDRHGRQFQHLPAVPDHLSRWRSPSCWSRRWNTVWRSGAAPRWNLGMALGLGIDVDSVFAVTFALGSDLAGLGGARRDRRARPELRLLSDLRADSGRGRRAGLDPRIAAGGDRAGRQRRGRQYYVPTLGAFLIYLVMVSLLLWRPSRPVRPAISHLYDRSVNRRQFLYCRYPIRRQSIVMRSNPIAAPT